MRLKTRRTEKKEVQKIMKKRLLSILLALCLVCGLMPVSAFAADTAINDALGLSADVVTFENDATYPWAVDAAAKTLSSTNHSHESSSTLTATLKTGYTLVFEVESSSEGNCDQLAVTLPDGSTKVYDINYGAVQLVWCNDSGSDQTITWSYSKDGSINAGDDTAYIRNVRAIANGTEFTVSYPDGFMSDIYTVDGEGNNVPVASGAKLAVGTELWLRLENKKVPADSFFDIWRVNGLEMFGTENGEPAVCVQVCGDMSIEEVFVKQLSTDADGNYLIGSLEELQRFSRICYIGGDYSGKTVKLTADIKANGASYAPASEFFGTFDGAGHTIDGLNIEDGYYSSGLIGRLAGEVKDLNLTNVRAYCEGGSTGGIAGELADNGQINRCFVSGIITGEHSVGGIAGIAGSSSGNTSIMDCEFNGLAIGNYAGGIAGRLSAGSVESCVARGSVAGEYMAGGIVGAVESGSNTSIHVIANCIALQDAISSLEYASRVFNNQKGGRHGLYALKDMLLIETGILMQHSNDTEKADEDADGKDVALADATAIFAAEHRFTAANGWILPEGNATAFPKRGDYTAPSADFSVTAPSNVSVYAGDRLLGRGSGSYTAPVGSLIRFEASNGYTISAVTTSGALQNGEYAILSGSGAGFTVGAEKSADTVIWVIDGHYLISNEIKDLNALIEKYQDPTTFHNDATDSEKKPLEGSYPGAWLYAIDGSTLCIGELDLGGGKIISPFPGGYISLAAPDAVTPSTAPVPSGEPEPSEDPTPAFTGISKLTAASIEALKDSADLNIDGVELDVDSIRVDDEIDLKGVSGRIGSIEIMTDCCGAAFEKGTVLSIGTITGPATEEDGEDITVDGDSTVIAENINAGALGVNCVGMLTVTGSLTSTGVVSVSGVLDVRGSITADNIIMEGGCILNAVSCTPRPSDRNGTLYYRTTLTGFKPDTLVYFVCGNSHVLARADANGQIIAWLPAGSVSSDAFYGSDLTTDAATAPAGELNGEISADGGEIRITAPDDTVDVTAKVPTSLKAGEKLKISDISVGGKKLSEQALSASVVVAVTDEYSNSLGLTCDAGIYETEELEEGVYYVTVVYSNADQNAEHPYGHGVVTYRVTTDSFTISGGNPTYPVTIPGGTAGGRVKSDKLAADAGVTVTLTPMANKGYYLSSLRVSSKAGEDIKLTDNGNGTYSFAQPRGGSTVSFSFSEDAKKLPFKDVKAGDWFEESVRYVYENGIMNGVKDDTFDPNGGATRAMIATMIYRLEGSPKSAGGNKYTPTAGHPIFGDVGVGSWYYDAVIWCAANGIVEGDDNGNFNPNASVTREQLAAMLHRYAKFKGYDVSVGENTNILSYNDAFEVSEYAIPAMQWVCGSGIMNGIGESLLAPRSNAERSHVAAIFMRFCELYK